MNLGNQTNIIDISNNSIGSSESTSRSVLSKVPSDVSSLFIDELKPRFNALFSDTDDHLFDKSGKSNDSRHFAALRTLRVKQTEVSKAFYDFIKQGFAEALGKKSFEQEEQSINELSLDSLSLVEESDLEERIALDSMSSKAVKRNKLAIDNIGQRLNAVSISAVINDENNPLAPEQITQGISHCLQNIDIDTEFKLVIFKFFERSVIDELDLIYQKINQYFIEQGILPDLKLVPVKQRASQYIQRSSDTKQQDVHVDENTGGVPAGNDQLTNGEQLFSVLSQLLSQNRSADINHTIPAQPVVETPELINVLSQLQSTIAASSDNQLRDIRLHIGSQINSENNQPITRGSLEQANDDMIDVVTMLFDFILDDENLHSEIKATISRLQIPILKVGLSDKTFFSDRQHAARLLLNELAHAGLSWEPNDKAAAPMLKKIQQVVELICNDYVDQKNFFAPLLENFRQFRGEYRRTSLIFERRTKEAEEGKAKTETARLNVNNELKKICKNKKVPEIAKAIFKNVWSHVMFLESLRKDSKGWDTVVKIARMLIWSLQTKNTQSDLEKLNRFIPAIVKNLKLGFDKISYSPIDASRLLDQLEKLHREVIAQTKIAIEEASKDEIIRLKPQSLIDEPIIEPAKSSKVSEETVEEIVVEDVAFSPQEVGLVEPKPANIEISKENRQTIESFSAGSWFELKIDQEFRKTKLAAKISSTGKYIFVNRSGVKVAEFFTDELAAAYQLGEIKLLDDEALFDRALKAVISNLREMKSEQ